MWKAGIPKASLFRRTDYIRSIGPSQVYRRESAKERRYLSKVSLIEILY